MGIGQKILTACLQWWPYMGDIHFELGERITVVQQFPNTEILEKTK